MNNRFRQIKKPFGPYRCHSCQYRYSDCDHDFGNKPDYCKDYYPGGCLSCKYRYGIYGNDFTPKEDTQWLQRGCDIFFPSSLRCTKRKRLGRKRKKRLKKRGLL